MEKNKIINYYFITLLILLSGNVFFSLKYTNQTRKILILSSIVFMAYNILKNSLNFKNKNLLKFLFFCILVTFSFFINSQNGIILNNLLMLIGILSSVYIFKEHSNFNDFKQFYIKIMKWICIISLVCYFLSSIITPEQFPFFRKELLGTDIFMYSFYHSWGWGIGTTRNSGMFWEPGAFQCYINLAIIILLFDKQIIKNKNDLIIFIITILTTQSTTGYMITIAIILYCVITQKIEMKNKIISILVMIVCIFITLYMSNSEIISSKFEDNNTSYSLRKNDLEGSLKIVSKYPITGIGYVSDLQFKEQEEQYIEKNSNGFLIFAMQFGIPILCVYIILLFLGLKKIIDMSNLDTLFVLAIIITMHSSENIMLYPLWIYLII